ncbi:hypothetical protein FB451DRAFT_1043258 [Mycena latifolia]|nr:hypothetical protein FB451DRAFT_1043258 [Mycena latifolia]
MKFVASLLTGAMFAATAFAQSVQIGAPANGSTVTGRSKITLTIAPTVNIAVAIAMAFCGSSAKCAPPTEDLGIILEKSVYNPTIHNITDWSPYENFTVTVPNDLPVGIWQLNIAHFAEIGVLILILNLYP